MEDLYEINSFICPFCGSEEYMKIVKNEDGQWYAVAGQICSECDEPFDLEYWKRLDDYDFADFDEENMDDDEEFILRNEFFLDDEEIDDGEDDE